jgi:hypothetical protein
MSSFLVIRCRKCRQVVANIRQPETPAESEGYAAERARYSGSVFSSSVERGPRCCPGCICHAQEHLFPSLRVEVVVQVSLFGGEA